MKAILGFLTLLLLGLSLVMADEPSWTPAERRDRRVAVVTGRVTSITVLQQINQHCNWVAAEIEVANVVKTHPDLPNLRLTVHFQAARGNTSRCPEFAAPKIGENADFYLSYRPTLTPRNHFVIEMNSDIIRAQAGGR